MKMACTQARDFLAGPTSEVIPGLLEHLAHCEACQEFFTRHEDAFSKALEMDPLGELGSLATLANQRLEDPANQPEPKAPTYWPAPEIEGYRLEQQIALTKQSQVFVATQLSLGRPVALKIIRAKNGGKTAKNLAREAQIQANLKHPNILNIYETGTWESGVWLALEYCPRGSLADMLESRRHWDPREAAALIRKVALGVHAANAIGLVHRDIKPANILIGSGHEPMLADFGFAESVDRTVSRNHIKPMVGTPAYMAPEQARGGIVDARSDVHALGAVLYHLLAGHPPFAGELGYDSLLQVAHTMPISPWLLNPSLSRDLCEICMKCLAKDPDQRYQTARDLSQDLERYLQGKPVQARPLTQWELGKRWVVRNKAKALGIGGGLVLLASSAVGFALLSFWAMTEKGKAMEQEGRAGTMRELAEREAYASKIQMANTEWDHGTPSRTRFLLESCPFYLRGWEHDHLATRLNQNQVTFVGHNREVHGLVADPGGKWVASGSLDGTIRFWDLVNGQEARARIEVGEPVYGMSLSQDGKILAAGSETGNFHIYDLAQGGKIANFALIPNRPYRWIGEALSLDREGKTLYSEGAEHRVEARDSMTGKLIRAFDDGHKNWIRAITLAKDGSLLATGGVDRRILLWDAITGKKLRELTGHTGVVRALGFSPDGKELISSGNDNAIRVWDTATGALRHIIPDAHKDWILSLTYSPDGQYAASGSSDQIIHIWDTRNWKLTQSLKGHSGLVRALCYNPAGKQLASASWDHQVKYWNPGGAETPTHLPAESEARCVQFHTTGRMVAIGTEQGLIQIHDASSGERIRVLEGHSDQVQDLSFHPDGEYLASCSRDSTVRIWRLSDGSCTRVVRGFPANLYKLGYMPDGGRLLAAGSLGKIGIIDPAGKVPVRFIQGHEGQIRALAISKDGRHVATAGDDLAVRVWLSDDWSIRAELRGHDEQIRSLGFNQTGTRLLSGSLGSGILMWDLSNGSQIQHLHGHLDGVTFVAFNPDDSRVISASFDRTVKIWNAENGQELLSLSRHSGGIRGGALSPDGKMIASASDDRSVNLWKATGQMERQNFQGRFGLVRDAVFLGQEEILAIRDPVGRQRFWDFGRNREAVSPSGPVDWEMWARPKVESRDGKWLLEVRDQELLLVNREIRKKRQDEEKRRLKEWARKGNAP